MDDLYTIQLTKVTGLLIFGQQSTHTYTGTKAELTKIYNDIRTYNLLAGWWGIIAIVWNIMALKRNADAKRQLDNL